jgi:hypothetical protein
VTRNVGGKRLVVGIERRQLRPERDARSARQRAHVDQQMGGFFVGECQRVGENQTALGVGVADLDIQSLARRIDIERTERVAGY